MNTVMLRLGLLVTLCSLLSYAQKVKDPVICGYSTSRIYNHKTYNDPPIGNCRCNLTIDSDPKKYSRPVIASGPRYSFPEWSRARGVIVAFIDRDSLNGPWGKGFGVPLELLRVIAEREQLFILMSPPNRPKTRKLLRDTLKEAKINLVNVHVIPVLLDSWWTRDYGPMFVHRQVDANTREVLIGAHTYNRVQQGAFRCRMNDNQVPCKFAEYLGIPCEVGGLQLTGGNFMADEFKTGASTDLTIGDNPTLTLAQINQKFKTVWGVDPYLLVADPQSSYIDHVDTWSKFIGSKRIVVAQVPSNDPDYTNIEAAAQFFANNGFTVHRVQTIANDGPDPVIGFYMNSLWLNERFYVPTINSTNPVAVQLNQAALTAWQTILGNTVEVVGIPSTESVELDNSWFPWDALHCRVREVPDIGLYVKNFRWPNDSEGLKLGNF